MFVSMQAPTSTPSNTSVTGFAEKHSRAYKACLACRQRKAKCDLGQTGRAPCYKCHREQRECVFETERQWGAKRRRLTGQNEESDSKDANTTTPGSRHRASSTADTKDLSPAVHNSLGDHEESGHDETTTTSMIRAVVSNGTEALDLLLQGVSDRRADHDKPSDHLSSSESVRDGLVQGNGETPSSEESSRRSKTLKVWQSSKFVRTGWMTAESAIMYMDLFFENLAPLTPIVTMHYADHANHAQLLAEEPLLCSTIIMISSRWHTLPVRGGLSRGYFVHEKSWKLCQRLIGRLTYGQEFGPHLKVRTVGSIEALLLMSEWHARELYFPPEDDGWDLGLLDKNADTVTNGEALPNVADWLQHPSEAAKRSGRMSWLLLGTALSLSHELKIFSDCDEEDVIKRDPLWPKRKIRIRQLLFIFTNQLSSRLGCGSMLPMNLSLSLRSLADADHMHSNHSVRSIEAWIELMKLLRSLCDMVFPSKTYTRQLLEEGRYANLLEHFRSLLKKWHEQYMLSEVDDTASSDMLIIEYHYVRILCNSVGMQAIHERSLHDPTLSLPDFVLPLTSTPDDHRYHEEVIHGGCDLLETVLRLEDKGALRYAPVRVLLRITAGSMFLLKALAMGVRESQLRRALAILDATVVALRKSVLDDMHLSGSFATVLETHVSRIRTSASKSSRRFLPSLPNTQRHSPVPVVEGSNEHADLNGASARAAYPNSVDVHAHAHPHMYAPHHQPAPNGIGMNGVGGPHADMVDWSNFGTDGIGDGWLDLSSESTLAPLMPGGDLYSWMQV